MISIFFLFLVLLQWWHVARLRDDIEFAQRTMFDIWRNHPPAFPLETLANSVYVPASLSPLAAFDGGDGPWLGQSIWLQVNRISRIQDQLGFDLFPSGRQTNLTASLLAQYLIPCLAVFLAWRQASLCRTRTLQSWITLQTKLIELVGPPLALCCLMVTLLERQSLGIEGAIRLMLILGVYLLYSITCGSLAWGVYQSWRSIPRSTAVLVFFWLLNFTLARPLSANLAAAVFATPTLDAYVQRLDAEITNGYKGVEPRLDRERRFVAEILREYNAESPSETPVNFSALLFKREEAFQRDVGHRLRAELISIFEQQERLEQSISLLFPIIAIQISSSALAATDFASERFQLAQADQFWARTLDRIYLDVARSSGPNAIRVPRGPDYWSNLPFFTAVIPPPPYALNACLIPSAVFVFITAGCVLIVLSRRPHSCLETTEETSW
ncbi:MAG: DUF3526 domain-containing protein [Acidobacteriota bacterium]